MAPIRYKPRATLRNRIRKRISRETIQVARENPDGN